MPFQVERQGLKIHYLYLEEKQVTEQCVECDCIRVNVSQPVEWRVPGTFLVKSTDLGVRSPEFAFTSCVILCKSFNPSMPQNRIKPTFSIC